MEFHDGALGIGKVFGQESTVVKGNYQILSLHLVRVCQKVPILDFQNEFFMSKIIRIYHFFSLKNTNLGAHFLFLASFDNFDFKSPLNDNIGHIFCQLNLEFW